jgi:hypothetical protein
MAISHFQEKMENANTVRMAAECSTWDTNLVKCTHFAVRTLGTHRPQLEQRMGFTCPRPCLLRPPLRRFTVITAALYHNTSIKAHKSPAKEPKGCDDGPETKDEKKTLNPEKEQKTLKARLQPMFGCSYCRRTAGSGF